MMAAQCECTLYHRTVHLKMAMMEHFMLCMFQHNKKNILKQLLAYIPVMNKGNLKLNSQYHLL